MLLNRTTLEGVAAGRINLVFRRWRQPGVKSGGTLVTTVGLLAIEAVDAIADSEMSDSDAMAAGHSSRAALLEELSAREGQLYRVRLRLAGPDPRLLLRDRSDLSDSEAEAIAQQLKRLDARRAWTIETLDLVAAHPGRRAPDLAAMRDRETTRFKQDVRKLKELGLTESLDIGYRLSPRGGAFRAWLIRLLSKS